MYCRLLTRRSMVRAINIIHGCGPRNKMYPQNKAVLVDNMVLYALYITNKVGRFSFKSGCVIQVAKRLKEDWFIVVW